MVPSFCVILEMQQHLIIDTRHEAALRQLFYLTRTTDLTDSFIVEVLIVELIISNSDLNYF